ncbi:hypothetical protein GCM10010307_01840 [Streptomyces vastus]|uniref:Uncharacterized protein n=1 Tax=Streptomyces vastus TaxID=285451 RepID=A0ABN3Q7B1_9ACTN
MVRGVPGGRHGAQGQARIRVDLRTVAVVYRYRREGDPGPGRDEIRRTRDPGQLQAAGDVVVVDVRLDDVRDQHPTPGRRRDHLIHVTGRGDRRRRPLAARQVTTVAEPGHLDRVDEEHEVLPSNEGLPLGVYLRP